MGVLALVFLIGVGLLGGAVFSFQRQLAILNTWPETIAEVSSIEVVELRGRRGRVYKPYWELRYMAAGAGRSAPARSGSSYSSAERARAAANQRPMGKLLPLRYDPENPYHIEMNAGFTPGFFLLPLILGFVGAGTLIVARLVYRYLRANPVPRCTSCRSPVTADFKFCPSCATRLSFGRVTRRPLRTIVRKQDPRVGYAVGGGFAAAGLGLAWLSASMFYEQFDVVRNWLEVEAEVVSNRFDMTRSRTHENYWATLDLKYQLDGVPYSSTTSTRDSSSGFGGNSYAYVRRIADRYAPGSRHMVRVNPADPRQARIEARVSAFFFGAPVGVGFAALVFGSVGLAVLLASLPRRRVGCASCGESLAKSWRYCPKCAKPPTAS